MTPTLTKAKARLSLVLLDTAHSASKRTASGVPEAVFFAALNEGERYKWRRVTIHDNAQNKETLCPSKKQNANSRECSDR